MSFNAMTLPPKVQDAFYSKNIDWNVLYWTARKNGISNENNLADILFYHAHKELVFPGGSVALKPGMTNYTALSLEWKKFKQLAQSLSHASSALANKKEPKDPSKTDEAKHTLKVAEIAMNYTRQMLSFGAGNRLDDVIDSGGLSILGTIAAKIGGYFVNPGKKWSVCEIRTLATYARAAHAGNCGEHAAVAFIYLYDRMIRPIDIMSRVNADHQFVVIGREKGIAHKLSTWGGGAVVCDPWMRRVYLANEINRVMGKGTNVTPISVIRSEEVPVCHL